MSSDDTFRAEPGDSGPDPSAPIARGYRWDADDRRELREVIDAAFDYRGDVTLTLRSGQSVEGYIANKDYAVREPFVDVFPSDGGPKQRHLIEDVVGLDFSGKDTASGKSWETWISKWNAKKEDEARGETIGDIGLYPESLD